MTIKLKQSTDSQEIPLGYFLDSTNGDDEETVLTIANTDIKLWKRGATTLANKNSGGATHMSNGIYYTVLDATDSNTLGSLIVFVHVSGALAVRVECEVLTANRFDSEVLGTDYLQIDAVEISGDSTAANNLELDYDGTGYEKTNSTIGTCTANTDLVTTTYGEPAQGAPPATTTIEDKISYIYTKLRNKEEVTASVITLYADNGTTEIMKSNIADNGTTFTKAEFETGT